LLKVEIGGEVKVFIEEIKRDDRTSTVRVTQNKKSGSSMADILLLAYKELIGGELNGTT